MAAPDTADSVDSDKETMKCNLYANEMLIYKTKIQKGKSVPDKNLLDLRPFYDFHFLQFVCLCVNFQHCKILNISHCCSPALDIILFLGQMDN